MARGLGFEDVRMVQGTPRVLAIWSPMHYAQIDGKQRSHVAWSLPVAAHMNSV